MSLPNLYNRRFAARLTAATLMLALCALPAAAKQKAPRLVLLYATCTLNKLYLSPYNTGISFTPHLEALSRESTVFMNHRTEAGLSGVAYASIFSGNPSLLHGVFTHPTVMSESAYLMSEAFADNGYQVYFWNDHLMASADLGYGQGVPAENVFDRRLSHNDKDFQSALERLRKNKQSKVFIVTNFTATHAPYSDLFIDRFCDDHPGECRIIDELPATERIRYRDLNKQHYIALQYNFAETVRGLGLSPNEIDRLSRYLEFLYRTNVSHLDGLFGDVVEAIRDAGVLDESLIVFTADHGETLRRESSFFNWSHGHTLQADVLDVPLIIRAPKLEMLPGEIQDVTRSIDLLPTLASMSRLKMPRNNRILGQDLSKLLSNERKVPSLLAYSHSAMLPPTVAAQSDHKIGYLKRYYPSATMELTWVAVREKDMVWKHRRSQDGEWHISAYDISRDPHETIDVFDPQDAYHKEMTERLKKYNTQLLNAYKFWQRNAKDKPELSKSEQRRRLKSLGYLD